MKKKIFFTFIIIVNIFAVSVIANEIIQYQAYKSDAKIIINGNEVEFNLPVVTINDWTYVPLRNFSDNLDMNVIWNEHENEIIVNDKELLLNKLLMLSFRYQDDWETPKYDINVYDNGVYEVREERVTTLSLNSIRTETFYLEESDMSKIKNLLNEITDDYSQSYALLSRGWIVSLNYNNQIYPYNFGYYKSEYMKELIDTLIELSPIEIPAIAFQSQP